MSSNTSKKPDDDSPKPPAINDTPFRRFVTLVGLKTTARLYSRQGICVPISKGLIVKSGAFVDLTEAATMEFVAKNTSIPVPKVYCAFERKGRAYIVMERIRGEPFSKSWTERSEETNKSLIQQLKAMIDQLRALKPPGTAVQSSFGGSLADCRITNDRFGPFPTIQAFYQWIRLGLSAEESEKPEMASEEDWQEVKAMMAKQNGPWPPPVFTHADLNPCNILVRGDKVVGVIDWEFSGWYPYHWEYTAAWCTNPLDTMWQEILGMFLDTFPKELEMEASRIKFFGGY